MSECSSSVLSLSLLVVWVCLFCDYLLLTIAIPIFPTLPLAATSDTLTGVLFSSKACLQILFSPLVSCYVDRWALELLLGGMIVEGVATVIFTLTQSYPLWLLGRMTQGIASSAIITASFGHLKKHYVDDKQRGVAMSIATTGIIGGVMFGPPIGGVTFGIWKPLPFVLAMLLCFVAAGGVALLRAELCFWACLRSIGIARGASAATGGAGLSSKADVQMASVQMTEEDAEALEAGAAMDGGDLSEDDDEGEVEITLAGTAPLDALASTAAVAAADDDADATKAKSALSYAKRIVCDRRMLAVLGSVWVANAAISCLEANIGSYLQKDMGLTVSQSGLMYIVTALPSVAASAVAGTIGNRCGRWQTVCFGLLLQGSFYALGPKSSMAVECISLIGLGVGMGLVDGVTPALLGKMSDERFDGTAVIYAINTATVQLGFMVGPVGGGAMKELFGFQTMSIVLGLIVALYAFVVIATFGNARRCYSACASLLGRCSGVPKHAPLEEKNEEFDDAMDGAGGVELIEEELEEPEERGDALHN
tara:strand:+ start:116 stop:1726 length:1611 start_codon:yes stop_codon:yes gene_type:complete